MHGYSQCCFTSSKCMHSFFHITMLSILHKNWSASFPVWGLAVLQTSVVPRVAVLLCVWCVFVCMWGKPLNKLLRLNLEHVRKSSAIVNWVSCRFHCVSRVPSTSPLLSVTQTLPCFPFPPSCDAPPTSCEWDPQEWSILPDLGFALLFCRNSPFSMKWHFPAWHFFFFFFRVLLSIRE